MHKYRTIACLVIFALMITGCSAGEKNVVFETGIERYPEPQSITYNGPMDELPEFNPSVQSRPNLRGADLTNLDLSDKLETLLNSGFSTTTLWPDILPEGFDPERILDLNKNPGLNIRLLHEQGITGSGVGVAVIDYALLVEHVDGRIILNPTIRHPGTTGLQRLIATDTVTSIGKNLLILILNRY